MPKRTAEQYEDDGGFVEDAPKSKKSNKSKQSTKAQPNLDMQTDGEGNPFWQLSGKRRVVVSSFKGAEMVSIREYYDKNGEMKPGSKGITMTLEQYNTVVQLLPQIETVLNQRGVGDVARPAYSGISAGAIKNVEDKEEEEEAVERNADEDGEQPAPRQQQKTKYKLDKFRHKKNHEATSGEED